MGVFIFTISSSFYNLPSNIIHINFNDISWENICEYHDLNKYVLEHYESESENYLFIDEVQICEGFEKAINSLHNSKKFHIYITGSNAFLLSSDLATLFTGRTFEIPVFPFSFAEYKTYFDGTDNEALLSDYVKQGGMAGSFTYSTEQQKYGYIKEVFSALIVRDIKQKYKIRNTDLLEKLNNFLMDNISTEVSTQKLAKTLVSNQQKANNKTIGSYLNYLCNAFAFYKVRRYDIRGKKYLASQDKYYLADHSFRYAILGTKNMDHGRVYENMVCIELLRRGYEVYTGVLYKKEIDFVAIKQSEKIYIQVSDDISSPETFEREVAPLLSIKDAYPKVLIARTRHEKYLYEGINIINIADFLLGNAL
ncbi:MAG: ATP-binding protein [Treponema sp.]|uniref:ATP-binding protein n=1 Tax=Treponema sp. TaxID=166 RepID=UPI0025E8AEA1|nr:ATP-binding protein [Treponema sp.]MBR0495293.1 ATP-binding protein [Treponema sp.]